MKTLWSYGTWTDEYGVVYSEDKKELLSFPQNYSHSIYVVNENCIKISEKAFSLPFQINSCSGEEFLERNRHIKIEECENGDLILVGSSDVYDEDEDVCLFTDKAKSFLKSYMDNPCAELRKAIAQCSYKEVVTKNKKNEIILVKGLLHPTEKPQSSLIRKMVLPSLAISVPMSAFSIIKKIDEVVIISKGVPSGKFSRFTDFKSLSSKWEDPVFSENYIDIINTEEITNWAEFSKYHGLKNNRYIQNIRTFIKVKIENDKNFPVILFPDSLKKQMNKKFDFTRSTIFPDYNIIIYNDILCIALNLQLKGYWGIISEPENPYFPNKNAVRYKVKEKILKGGSLKRFYRKLTGVFNREYKKLYLKELEGYYSYICNEKNKQEKEYHKKKRIQAEYIDFYADKIASLVWRKSIVGKGGLLYADNPRSGRYEETLYAALFTEFPDSLKINRKKGIYYPDFVIDIDDRYFIDIEIDEPYASERDTMTPIHYVGADDVRNDYFTSENWFVVRFAEQQVKEHIQECVSIINCMVKFIKSGNAEELIPLIGLRKRITVPRWTRDDSMGMEIVKTRDNGYEEHYCKTLHRIWKEISDQDKNN